MCCHLFVQFVVRYHGMQCHTYRGTSHGVALHRSRVAPPCTAYSVIYWDAYTASSKRSRRTARPPDQEEFQEILNNGEAVRYLGASGQANRVELWVFVSVAWLQLFRLCVRASDHFKGQALRYTRSNRMSVFLHVSA